MATQSAAGWGKRRLIEIAVGGFLGLVAWAFTGPRMVSWWYKPPAGDAISCGTSVQAALLDFTRGLLAAAVVGGAVVVIGSLLVRRRLKSGTAVPTPAPASGGPLPPQP